MWMGEVRVVNLKDGRGEGGQSCGWGRGEWSIFGKKLFFFFPIHSLYLLRAIVFAWFYCAIIFFQLHPIPPPPKKKRSNGWSLIKQRES